MYRYTKLVIIVLLAGGAWTLGATNNAYALPWLPAHAQVVMDSTNFSLTIGKTSIACSAAVGEGTLGGESSTWTTTPHFSRCGSARITAGSAWTIGTVNEEEASITLPKGEKAGLTIELSPKCIVHIESGPTLGSSGDFENGDNGVSEPSLLALSGEKVSISGTSAECGESATTASLTTILILQNFTNAKEAISIGPPSGGQFWHVSGSLLKLGARQVKLQAKGAAIFKIPSLGVEFECKHNGTEGATIEGGGAGQGQDKGRLTYSACQTSLKECKVQEPITTNPMKSYLAIIEGAQQNVADVMELTEGKVIVELKFSGSGCGLLAGTQSIDGSIAATISPKGAETQESLFNFPSSPVEIVKHEGVETKLGLTFGGSSTAMTLSGAYSARLATGEPWGVFES